ncbi:hypothetical protein B1813_11155 [Saccharomonospora piscinae]|uniref:VOC domain-containing protein n=1 Tax=Saccharomonospora piscinae TaxID=687388 RepID=A0A1V9A6F2_SACPI|nr:VOC family protein [Saccharomonospora piscinae]OQO92707.1 hypothetical protein B1813_11155 [Saccharomonospora piscinae]TLW91584.1 bleomycin resistance protein [Saccharomonospora piscinae]
MSLTLDLVTLGVADEQSARAFYTGAFAATEDHGNNLDLHGIGKLELREIGTLASDVGTSPATTGFRGVVLSAIVEAPSDVETLLGTATDHGATVVKPAKKQLFGEFTGAYRAPDGALWKLAATAKKNTTPPHAQPKPLELAVYLGVAKPTASQAFYEALGMSADHDYGDKFVDFTRPGGGYRLGLLPRKALAKDVGVDERGDGFSAVVLAHTAASRDDLDALLKAAAAAGGRVTAPASRTADGRHTGRFTDPDGYHWRVTAPG